MPIVETMTEKNDIHVMEEKYISYLFLCEMDSFSKIEHGC